MIREITDDELKKWWFVYGPQPEEDPIIRSIHDWDFLRLVATLATMRGVKLKVA
jgi:hypothetical protein